jgi:hypothetical protein
MASQVVVADVRALGLRGIVANDMVRLTSLRRLDATANELGVGRESVSALGAIPLLSELILSDNRILSLRMGGGFAALRELDVSGNVSLGPSALGELTRAPCAARLARLNMSGCSALGESADLAVEALSSFASAATSLTDASFDACCLSSSALFALCHAASLQALSFASNSVTELTAPTSVEDGRFFLALTSLSLERNPLSANCDIGALLNMRSLRDAALGGTPAAAAAILAADKRGNVGVQRLPAFEPSATALDSRNWTEPSPRSGLAFAEPRRTSLVMHLTLRSAAAARAHRHETYRLSAFRRLRKASEKSKREEQRQRSAAASAYHSRAASASAAQRAHSLLRLGPVSGPAYEERCDELLSPRALFGGAPIAREEGLRPMAAPPLRPLSILAQRHHAEPPPHNSSLNWRQFAREGDALMRREHAASAPASDSRAHPPPILLPKAFPLLSTFALPQPDEDLIRVTSAAAAIVAPAAAAAAAGRPLPAAVALASGTPRPPPGKGSIAAAVYALRQALLSHASDTAPGATCAIYSHESRARSERVAASAAARQLPRATSVLHPREARSRAPGYSGPDPSRGPPSRSKEGRGPWGSVVERVGYSQGGGLEHVNRLLAPVARPIGVLFDPAFASGGEDLKASPPVLHAQVRISVAALRAATAGGIGPARAPDTAAASVPVTAEAPTAAPQPPPRLAARARLSFELASPTRGLRVGFDAPRSSGFGTASAVIAAAAASSASTAATLKLIPALLAGVDSALGAHIASHAAARAVTRGRERHNLLSGIRDMARDVEVAAMRSN